MRSAQPRLPMQRRIPTEGKPSLLRFDGVVGRRRRRGDGRCEAGEQQGGGQGAGPPEPPA